MSGTRRVLRLLVVLAVMIAGCVSLATAQVPTTTVQDTVYSANGTPAGGTVLVSWSSFTTAGGQLVPAGNTSAVLGAGGQLTIALAPNAGASPMGSFYTAVFHLSDGTTSRVYWVIPVTVPGAGPATLAQITNQVLPSSVAMQTVSKQYVDNAIAAAATGSPLDSSPYVQKIGDTMSGPLVLPADPVSANQAADKNYVDENVAALAGGLGQKVSLLPMVSQTIAQPGGTSFSISGGSASSTVSGGGVQSQNTITTANTVASPGTGGYTLLSNQSNCFEPGYNLGNNGTSAQGWSTCALEDDILESATRGISQLHAGNFSHFAQGDTAAFYTYLTSFGGNVAASDEAVTHTVAHSNQMGYYTGVVATGGTTGSNLLTTTAFSCHGFCQTMDNSQFADGGILLDTSKGGSTATLATLGNGMNGTFYTLASGTVPVSTAWGNIVPSSCTNNGNGQWQNYTSTTCNVTLGAAPASPGNFVAGTDACLAGPFQEEAGVTAVGSASAGVQSITFNTRYAWNSGNAALVMQGGVCGESLVAAGAVNSWPVAYALVGATSPTQVFFSNCLVGGCNGSGNILQAAVTSVTPMIGNWGTSLVRNGNVVTLYLAGGGTDAFPPGSTILISGATPSDLNGSFTVATNTMDNANAVMTWAQSGGNESATGTLVVSTPPKSVAFYPSAFITGTNNGVSGNVQLATNQVPFAAGDTVVGAPTSQFTNSGLNLYMGQTTTVSGSNPSSGVNVADEGPTDLYWAYSAYNNIGNGVSPEMFNITGSYNNVFRIGYRPANNGTLLYVQGGEPVSANAKPYYIFQDNQSGGGKFGFSPTTGTFSFGGPVTAPSITAVMAVSAFAAGTTIGGVLPCLQNGTNCPAGSGGTGSVTSVTAGTWPSWLTPTVSNGTTTPSIAVVASAIPNAALANSATTVNGTSCALGGSCTIATGSSTPALTYNYFPAAVSDGGMAFAGAFTRYSSNAPPAGSVASGSSALGYLLFQASPSQPQYAELTTTAPPFWTSTGIYLHFYSSATSGNAVLDVQAACVVPGQVAGSPSFSTAVVTSTVVSTTANGMVRTALISGVATPGVNGCPAAGMTTPTMLVVRVYADATSAVPVYFTGATLVTGRSQ